MERASALASLISWIMEMGLEFPMVRSELNSPSVTNPGKGTVILDKENGQTKRIETVIKLIETITITIIATTTTTTTIVIIIIIIIY